jgi:hypothetical protein
VSSPVTQPQGQDKHKTSYVFSGVVNTIAQGECIPIAYGEVMAGSAVVSAGIESRDITAGAVTSSSTTSAPTSGTQSQPIASNREISDPSHLSTTQ